MRFARHSTFCGSLAVALAVVLLASPVAALAARYDSDIVGGRPLSSGEITRTLAPDIDASAGLIRSADGRDLWARKATSVRAMASITKVMTCLIALERTDLDEIATVSAAAAKVDYAIGLREGERLTVRQLVELALVASSNDAAYALAEHVGGSVPAFVAEMNAHARTLGMNDTRFANPHGLDQAGHRSTAADLALLSREAMNSDEFRRIVRLTSVTLPAYEKRPKRRIPNTNELIGKYEGMLGVKTGFTKDAGYSLVTLVERDGITLSAVVLGTSSNAARFKQSKRLLDWGFEHLRVETVATTAQTVGAIPVQRDPQRSVPVRAAEKIATPVFDLDGAVTYKVTLEDGVMLPVFEGQPLGTIELVQGERVLTSVAAVAAADLASVGETVGAVPVSDYLDRTVTVRAAETSVPVFAFDPKGEVSREVTLDPQVGAPVTAGTRLGEIVYSQAGQVVARVPVVAAADVEAPSLLARIGTWFTRRWREATGQPVMATLELADAR